MLEYASNQLQKHIYFTNRKHYKYLFTHNGRPLKSLREITPAMKMLVVSDKRQFTGLFRKHKLVNFSQYQ